MNRRSFLGAAAAMLLTYEPKRAYSFLWANPLSESYRTELRAASMVLLSCSFKGSSIKKLNVRWSSSDTTRALIGSKAQTSFFQHLQAEVDRVEADPNYLPALPEDAEIESVGVCPGLLFDRHFHVIKKDHDLVDLRHQLPVEGLDAYLEGVRTYGYEDYWKMRVPLPWRG